MTWPVRWGFLFMALVACRRGAAGGTPDGAAGEPVSAASARATHDASLAPATRDASVASGSDAPLRPVAPRTQLAKAPALACAVQAELKVAERVTRAAIAVAGDSAHLLALSADGRSLSWWGLRGTQLDLRAEMREAAEVLQLALLTAGEGALWAVSLGASGTLRARRLHGRNAGPGREIAKGLDRRFRPAVAQRSGRPVVAFTKTVDGAMHTFVARLDGGDARDITPAGHGAAAPVFMLGADGSPVVAVDARAGVSPLLALSLDARLRLTASLVGTPVSQPYAPPLLKALRLPSGGEFVAYLAVGRLAATAIGLVPLRQARAPLPLSPSRGYGPLSFSAAVGERSAVFVMEQATGEAPGSPRRLVARVFDGSQLGAAVELAKSPAAQPLLVRGPGPGFLLAYLSAGVLQVATLLCDA